MVYVQALCSPINQLKYVTNEPTDQLNDHLTHSTTTCSLNNIGSLGLISKNNFTCLYFWDVFYNKSSVNSVDVCMLFQLFHDIAYKADDRQDLLDAINEFLDDSMVLPPGKWDRKTLLPIIDMAIKKAKLRKSKEMASKEGDYFSILHVQHFVSLKLGLLI